MGRVETIDLVCVGRGMTECYYFAEDHPLIGWKYRRSTESWKTKSDAEKAWDRGEVVMGPWHPQFN